MNEIRQEFASQPPQRRQKSLGARLARLLVLFSLVALFGLYIGNLLFGNNSFSTYLSLEEQRDSLRIEIERLKEQNAKYQKEYFELLKLSGK